MCPSARTFALVLVQHRYTKEASASPVAIDGEERGTRRGSEATVPSNTEGLYLYHYKHTPVLPVIHRGEPRRSDQTEDGGEMMRVFSGID